MRKSAAISLSLLITGLMILEPGEAVRANEIIIPVAHFLDELGKKLPPKPPRTYTADQVDAFLKAKSEDLEKAKADLNSTIAADRDAVRKQISDGLSALEQNLITDEVKQKLTDDVAALVQQRVNAQLDQMKAEMKAELLTALIDKMEQIRK
jgi:hypothetical protein